HLPGRGNRRTTDTGNGFWHRTAETVMRHPVIAVVVSVAILGAAASPLATINLGSPGISDFPQTVDSIRAYNTLQEEFATVRMAPVEIIVKGDVNSDDVRSRVAGLSEAISADPRFATVNDFEALDGGTGLLTAYVAGD